MPAIVTRGRSDFQNKNKTFEFQSKSQFFPKTNVGISKKPYVPPDVMKA